MQKLKFGMTTQQVNVWKQEYIDGFDAQQRGVSSLSNPHKCGTIEYNVWKCGWNTAAMTKWVMK